jgi:hypothetical protein
MEEGAVAVFSPPFTDASQVSPEGSPDSENVTEYAGSLVKVTATLTLPPLTVTDPLEGEAEYPFGGVTE